MNISTMTKEHKKTTIELYELVTMFFDKYENNLSPDEIVNKILEHTQKYPKQNIMKFVASDFVDIVNTVAHSRGYNDFLLK